MSLLDHAGDIGALLGAIDAIHAADSELHGARKGETVSVDLPDNLPSIRTRSGRHFRLAEVALVALDDPKPPKKPQP